LGNPSRKIFFGNPLKEVSWNTFRKIKKRYPGTPSIRSRKGILGNHIKEVSWNTLKKIKKRYPGTPYKRGILEKHPQEDQEEVSWDTI